MDTAVFTTLNERGYIYQSTNLEDVKSLLSADKPITFYLGHAEQPKNPYIYWTKRCFCGIIN